MLNVASNAADYNWQTWLMGIQRSFVSGGAGAVASAVGPMVMDPTKFNLGSGLRALLLSMGIGFLISGIVHMMIFLQTHPGPDPIVTTTQEESKTIQTDDGGIKQTKTTVTTQGLDTSNTPPKEEGSQ